MWWRRRPSDPGFQEQLDSLQAEQTRQGIAQADQAHEQHEQDIELTAQAGVQARHERQQVKNMKGIVALNRSGWGMLAVLAFAVLVIGIAVGFFVSVWSAQSSCGSAWAVGLPC